MASGIIKHGKRAGLRATVLVCEVCYAWGLAALAARVGPVARLGQAMGARRETVTLLHNIVDFIDAVEHVGAPNGRQ